jgi:1-acyl-sn-glycerol-3-phosphate acyltransferase
MMARNPFEYRRKKGWQHPDDEAPVSIDYDWGWMERFYGHAGAGLANTFLRLLHGIELHGTDALPDKAPFVMVANHSSHLDTLILASALKRHLRLRTMPVAAADTFFVRPLPTHLTAPLLHNLPLWRRHPGRHTPEELRHILLTTDPIVIVFPEGTRSHNGKAGYYRPSVGTLVASTNIPVFPCYISGAYDVFPADAKRPGKGKIAVRVGSPRTFSDIPNDDDGQTSIARQLERAVSDLA